MTKQHLEGYLSKALKARNDLYFLKLQVMPLAHHPTPADFLVLSDEHNYLIECKECKNDRFELSRFTQYTDIFYFHKKFKKNRSYLMMMFWKGNLKKSDVFLIPIMYYKRYVKEFKKKSINLKDFNKDFQQYKISILNGVLNLNDIV